MPWRSRVEELKHLSGSTTVDHLGDLEIFRQGSRMTKRGPFSMTKARRGAMTERALNKKKQTHGNHGVCKIRDEIRLFIFYNSKFY